MLFGCANRGDRSAAVDVPNNMTVAITSDRGLCGGINTSVAKHVKATNDVLKELIQSGANSQPPTHSRPTLLTPCV